MQRERTFIFRLEGVASTHEAGLSQGGSEMLYGNVGCYAAASKPTIGVMALTGSFCSHFSQTKSGSFPASR